MIDDIHVRLAGIDDRDTLVDLVAWMEAEDAPDDSSAYDRARRTARRCLDHYDIFGSDTVWCLLAYVDGTPVGLAILTRVPKLDHRIGLLYLDELHVLEAWRRRGVGRALLQHVVDLSRELGLAGVRLLSRIENAPARSLYESAGFAGGRTMIYQYLLDRENPES
jgi:ribosomal protein S18 acetylase RimI-like enzyme